jgi:tripartite-type tricarboxylate transporter receptor subunit TctC
MPWRAFWRGCFPSNRGGAAGNVDARAAAQALPDGTTIHQGAQSLAANVTMAPVPNFDPRRDFEPVIATAQDVLMVPPQAPAHGWREWIDYARARPGELNYASLGTGSSRQASSSSVCPIRPWRRR